jgi:hypothetical protein
LHFVASRKLDIQKLKYWFIVAQASYFRIELMSDSFFQVSNCWNKVEKNADVLV